jgi:cytoskeletal protein CcmA (bactofilin family)
MYKISELGTVLRCFRAASATALTVLALLVVPSRAADMRAARQINIGAEQSISGNVYAAAHEFILSGRIDGDLVAAGGDVLMDGTVTQDVIIAGGDARLTGEIGGDLRVAAGRVELRGTVAGDVVAAGGTVRILAGSRVGGDVVAAGGTLLLEGNLARSVRAVGDRITLSATVSGPVGLRATTVEVGDTAVLESALAYFSPEEALISSEARIAGPVTFHIISGVDQQWLGHALRRLGLAFLLLGLAMSLVAGLVAAFLLRKPTRSVVQFAIDHFGSELLRGFVIFFVIPPAIFLLTLTVVGVPFAFLAGLFHLSVGIVSVVLTGVLLGSLLLRLFLHKDAYAASWQAVVLGVPLAFLVSIVPVVGFFFNTIFFLAIFGALYGRSWAAIREAL